MSKKNNAAPRSGLTSFLSTDWQRYGLMSGIYGLPLTIFVVANVLKQRCNSCLDEENGERRGRG